MRKIYYLLTLLPLAVFSQNKSDSTGVFQKRVLENAEINLLTSYYTQDGKNAAVTGGIGSEKLDDYATNMNISIPLNANDVLNIDATVSAYTSASSSNLNPFYSGASNSNADAQIDGVRYVNGTPWVASSGASRQDTWVNVNAGYSHSSKDRNWIVSGGFGFANEYDYRSIGANAGLVRLFNDKNSEISLQSSVFLDHWNPEYPTEIKTYIQENGNLNANFFNNVAIFNQNGEIIDKMSPNAWKVHIPKLIENKKRNTFAISLAFSQIINTNSQFSIFSDVTYQSGWLANPMQRVYFKDKANFYIGNPESIPIYTSPNNLDVFQLADDIERLPSTRIKIPIGIRYNQYINEKMVLRSYYRYYFDDWGLRSNTLNVELAYKLNDRFSLYPNYRFYNQTSADYFAPFEEHLSTSLFYTSDYDLSQFTANQFGIGVKYTDIFTKNKIWKFGLKSVNLDYNYYQRTTGLKAHIIALGANIQVY